MPPVAPTSYEANTVDLAIEMLAQSATFRTLTGAANAAAARGFIVNGHGGDPQQNGAQGKTTMADGTQVTRPANYAIVSSEDFQRERIAFVEYAHSGVIQVIVIATTTGGDTPADIMVRGRNVMGAIAAEIETQFGQSGRLLAGHVETHGPSLPETTGSGRGTYDFLIDLHWQDQA